MNEQRDLTGIELIALERQRQLTQEGWSTERDVKVHPNGELALAAACYLFTCLTSQGRSLYYRNQARILWPWADKWWKPTPDRPIRDLEKAGALIAAEIDRLQSVAALEGKR